MQIERLLTTEVPIIADYFDVYTTPHLAALEGPVARQVPSVEDSPFLHVHKWGRRS